ncbi:MAG: polysaccharide biosynthesis C-terminal domain-containing protein [Acidobacteriaceae bacterium]|nr:polysaccharide biosynthesis C-terminal domain-containing protein [Acidobacteriaceae bacterium]
MKRLRATVIKNASFNVLRGCTAAVAVLALPHFLTRELDAQRFSAWSLMLQIAAYATFLDFGLQTSVARFIAQAIELEQDDRRDRLVETTFVLLSLAGAVAFSLIGVMIAGAGHFFHGVPASLLGEFQLAAIFLALSAALALPLSTFSGVLIGMHRNEVPALAIGGSRVAGVVLAILVAQRTQSLVALSLCMTVTAIAGGLVQIPFTMRRMPSLRHLKPRIDRGLLAELLRFSGSLAVWNFGMLLISGLDLTIVAHFQFATVGYYAIGASAITLISGMNYAILTAFLAPQAALHARGEYERLASLLRRTTRINSLLNFLLSLGIILLAHPLLRHWVGEAYAIHALPVLIILIVAQAIRQIGAPYCMMLIATGEQRKGIWSGALEAVVNVTASIWLAHTMGYVGVAWGTLLGAVAGMAALLLYTVPRAQEISFSPWQLLESSLLRPLLCLTPLGAYTLAYTGGRVRLESAWLAAGLLASGLLSWGLGRTKPSREL